MQAQTVASKYPNSFIVVFADVGQGDCTIIRYPSGKIIMVDCGSKKASAIAKDTVPKVLAQLGANTIDVLVLTHPDVDHYNMLKHIKENGIQIDAIFFGGKKSEYSGVTLTTAKGFDANYFGFDGDDDLAALLSTDGVLVRVLAANHATNDKNEDSVVLYFEYHNHSLYLMGDATVNVETEILKAFEQYNGTKAPKYMLKSSDEKPMEQDERGVFLKVGHHGSLTATSSEWLAHLKPTSAYVSSDTLTFSGTGATRAIVMQSLEECESIYPATAHNNVFYNETLGKFQAYSTSKAIFTTLYTLGTLDKVKAIEESQTDENTWGRSVYIVIKSDASVEVMSTEDENVKLAPQHFK